MLNLSDFEKIVRLRAIEILQAQKHKKEAHSSLFKVVDAIIGRTKRDDNRKVVFPEAEAFFFPVISKSVS